MHEHFNVSEWLVDRHVEAGNGERIAIRSGGESLTYVEVLGRVEAAAGGLRALGVRCEERVAMVMLDSVEFVAMFLGALRIGAVPVPMNPLLPGRDLAVIVADSRARVVAISATREQSLAELRAGAPEVEIVISSGGGGDDLLGWADFIGAGSDGSVADTWAESPGFWLCTSGSTGQPKLAMHRHADIPATCETYADQVLGITADDICFSVGPMFHAYGLGNSLTFPFSVGATAVLEPTRPPTPQLVAGIVTSERPTLFFCIPTFYAALLASDLADDVFASVRFGVSAAEALPSETFERFRNRFGVTISTASDRPSSCTSISPTPRQGSAPEQVGGPCLATRSVSSTSRTTIRASTFPANSWCAGRRQPPGTGAAATQPEQRSKVSGCVLGISTQSMLTDSIRISAEWTTCCASVASGCRRLKSRVS